MTVFDVSLVAIMILSGVLALMRGVTRELVSIAAWVLAFLATIFFYPVIGPTVARLIEPRWLAITLTTFAIFMFVLIAGMAITHRWSQRLQETRAGALDRTLGFIFGVFRGLVIVALAYLSFAWLVPDIRERPRWIAEARLEPLVARTGLAILSIVPRDDRPEIATSRPSTNQGGTRDRAPQPESGTDNRPDTGYKPSERRGLDQLFQSTVDEQ